MKALYRCSNIELLRIVCMLFIVLHHILNERIPVDSIGTVIFYETRFFKSLVICAVNVYALVTGYFGIKFSIEKLVKLDLTVICYSAITLIIAVILGWHAFDMHDLTSFLPILHRDYWYVSSYAGLVLISPVLNFLVAKMDFRQFSIALCLGGSILFLWPTVCRGLFFYPLIKDGGMGITNLIYLYLLGRYIHRYEHRIGWANRSMKFYLSIYLLSALIMVILNLLYSYLLRIDFDSFFSYDTLFVLTEAVSLFLLFKSIRLSSTMVNRIASYSFMVYIFLLSRFFWPGFVSMIDIPRLSISYYHMAIFVIPIAMYLCVILIESVRRFLFTGIENCLIKKISSCPSISKLESVVNSNLCIE